MNPLTSQFINCLVRAQIGQRGRFRVLDLGLMTTRRGGQSRARLTSCFVPLQEELSRRVVGGVGVGLAGADLQRSLPRRVQTIRLRPQNMTSWREHRFEGSAIRNRSGKLAIDPDRNGNVPSEHR